MPRPGIPADSVLRRLVVAASAEALGNGIFLVAGLVYFTRHLHIPAERLGLALTAAQLLGVACGIPAGYLADVVGARKVLVAATAVQALAMLSYAAVSGVGQFFASATAVTVGAQAASAARGAFVAAAVTGGQRASGRAWLRAGGNVGLGAGSCIGAVALQLDDRLVYIALFIAISVLIATSASISASLPGPSPAREPGTRAKVMVTRDRGYLAFAAGNAVVSVHYGVFEVALPLWVVLHTPVPRWFAGLLVALNTCLVAMLQVRTSARVTDIRSAARSVRIAGIFLLLSFFLFGLAARLTVYGAGACLLVAMLVYVEGEMHHAAAAWTLSCDLAPDHLHGQYRGGVSWCRGMRNLGRAAGGWRHHSALRAHGMARCGNRDRAGQHGRGHAVVPPHAAGRADVLTCR